ncbi:MAG: FAD-dependent oxidoreductase [Nitrososphaerota archaeon]|nr:FAD-dependent oxidoreductase [Nitrososphaerota archaeon]
MTSEEDNEIWQLSEMFDPEKLTISRSSKLHRPRGYLCGTGMCPNCMMRVDGVPNVRVCTLVGNKKPRLEIQNHIRLLDTFRLTQKFSGLLKPGFQYTHFNDSRGMSNLFYGFLKRFTGLGRVATTSKLKRSTERLEVDNLVIGGGVSGMNAALKASNTKVSPNGSRQGSVLLVDTYGALGGDIVQRWQTTMGYSELLRTKIEEVQAVISKVIANERIKCLMNTRVVGYYKDENTFLAISERSTFEIRAKNVFVASGGHEVLPLFPNNDSPRVMLSLGAQILMNQRARLPQSAVVLDLNGLGPLVAADLVERGKMSSVKLTRTEGFSTEEIDLCNQRSIEILPKSIVSNVKNSGSVYIKSLKEEDQKKYDAGLVVVCGRYQPNFELALQLGINLRLVTGTAEVRILQGAAGVNAVSATAVGSLVNGSYGLGSSSPEESGQIIFDITTDEYMRHFAKSSDSYVCLCEDVTAKDMYDSIEMGYDYVESLKRYTGCLTGPCQGKQCALNTASMLNMMNPKTSGLLTTPRQPLYPLPLWSVASE